MESHEPRARDRAVERPLIGKCIRRFLLVTVATFVFWVALIYVFNRDVVVKHEIVISSLVGMHDQGDSDHATAAGMDSNHPKVVEKPGENIGQKFGSDGSGTEAEVRQPPRIDATGDGSTEELDHSASAGEEAQQPPVNIARRNGSDEERIDGKLTDDQVAQHPIRNETRGSSEPVNGTRPDEETQQPRRNVADGQGGGGSDEDQANDTDSGKASADETVKEEVSLSPERDSCDGRYIFVQILPRRFHSDLLRNCKSLSAWTDMCETLSNGGLGPELPGTAKALSETGWFSTNQFSLEVIFHNRMKQYKCLTNDSSVASAIYVPYYAGLDVARYLWHSTEYRDVGPRELVRWLRARPEWKRMAGKDHFLVAGRVSWDFRRETSNDSDWGTNLLVLPEVERMTSLVLESTLIPSATDFAIPYPTYFHPSSDADVIRWQNRMRKLKRRFLFSFAGARRPNLSNSIRDEIIDQCRASRSKCKLLECYSRGNSCDRPQNLIRLFQRSVFCLQPQGDSYTRRSTFDSILTGCIPVFFHSGSAYDQYKWHLPSDYRKYSVFIPEGDVKKGKVDIERVLSKIPRSKVEEMREAVIELIPKVLYADPRLELEKFEDAFDLAVKGVLARINNIASRGT